MSIWTLIISGLVTYRVITEAWRYYSLHKKTKHLLGTKHQLVFQSSITRLSSDALENLMRQHSEKGDSTLVIVDSSTVYILKQ